MWKKLQEFDTHISNNTIEPEMITEIYQSLKENGHTLDERQQSRNQLDAYFKEYRNLIRSSHTDLPSKCRLLHLIELRAGKWHMKPEIADFYEQKLKRLQVSHPDTLERCDDNGNEKEIAPFGCDTRKSSTQSADRLVTGSGSKSSGKALIKEDLLIRNSDSGKVMGIRGRRVKMIEEFSDTVISFQRVGPSQKERLLQISAPCQENIDRAKQLITETILRNTSPSEVPESNETTVIMPNITSDKQQVEGKRLNRHSIGTRLQRSSSMGHALVSHHQSEHLIHENVYTGNSTHVLRVSANTELLLSEAVQALRSHFDVKRSMRRYLPDFEFDESFSSDESENLEEADQNRKGEEIDCDSGDFTQIPAAAHRAIDSIVATSDVSSSCDDDDDEEEEEEKAGKLDDEDVKKWKERTRNGTTSDSIHCDSIISYDKDFLIHCSGSPLSQAKPENYELMRRNLSDIVKE
jgi:hypothetical protein